MFIENLKVRAVGTAVKILLSKSPPLSATKNVSLAAGGRVLPMLGGGVVCATERAGKVRVPCAC